jgi:pilus assembly protein CpaC
MKLLKALICLSLVITAPIQQLHSKSNMVEIAVEVTEINNNKATSLGIKWPDTFSAGQVANTVASRVPTTLPEPIGNFPSIITVGNLAQYTSLAATLQLLEQKGAAQILSKPKILTKSGTSAKFIVGGEIAIVAVWNVGGSIEWKEYGISQEVTPQIVEDNMIDLALQTEVSRLDYSQMSGGYPSIVKRQARSFVKVKSGQTITIAGLLQTEKLTQVSGIPLLCDIPIIGVLFGSKSVSEVKTNILIFVTPRIVEQ